MRPITVDKNVKILAKSYVAKQTKKRILEFDFRTVQ